jgi:hypothetical protein
MLVNWAPQLRILEGSVHNDAFLEDGDQHHGGLGAVKECILFGVL